MAIHGRKRISIFFACILLSMILSRLVWMQLRTYQVVPAFTTFSAFSYVSDDFRKNCRNNNEIAKLFMPFRNDSMLASSQLQQWFMQPSYILASKEICAKPEPIQFIIHAHWVCLTMIVLLGIFLARFLSSSWVLAIFVGATLMSRGALLALIGSYSETLPLTFFVTLWFTSSIHYMRTLSRMALMVALFATILGTMLSGSFIALGLAIPGFLFTLKRSNSHLPSDNSLSKIKPNENTFVRSFSPLKVKFSIWARSTPQFTDKLQLTWITLTALLLATHAAFKSYQIFFSIDHHGGSLFASSFHPSIAVFWRFLSDWTLSGVKSLDLHSLFSITVICIWGFSPYLVKVHAYTKEAVSFFMVCFVILFCATLTSGFIDFVLLDGSSLSTRAFSLGIMNPTPFLVWLEPIILTLGIIGLYHMLKRKTVSLER